MKKQAIALTAICLVLLLASCGAGKQNGGDLVSESETNTQLPDIEAEEPEDGEEEFPADNDFIYVADAAMYRGIIMEIQRDETEGTTLQLEQVEGTDFGLSALTVELDSDTKLSVNVEDLSVGDYVEVYYGMAMGAPMQETVSAIGVNRLPDADLSIFNGTVKEINREDGENGNFILLEGTGEEDSIMFFYTEETQMYLSLDELEEGDKLNVYFSGVTTRSIPPQATALEIRPYADAQ